MGKRIFVAVACLAAVAGCAPTNLKQLVKRNNVKTVTVDRPYLAVHKTVATSGALCFDSKYETHRERQIRTGATIFAAIFGGLGGAIAVASRRTHVDADLNEAKRQGTTTFYVTSSGPPVYGLHVVTTGEAKNKTRLTTYSMVKKAVEPDQKLVLSWLKDPTACPFTTRKIVRGPDGKLKVVEPPEKKDKMAEPKPIADALVTSSL
jgi:hypothetical protein